MIVEGKNMILGRLSSLLAKQLLNGETVDLINCEQIVVSGNKKQLFEKYDTRRERKDQSNPRKGPKFPRTPEKIVKRAVRGMLPYKDKKGSAAYKRLRAHTGVPKKLENKQPKVFSQADAKNKNKSIVTIKELAQHLGAKI